MFWGLKQFPFGGPMIQRFGEEYHLFSTTVSPDDPDDRKRVVFHAVSRDMIRWERLPDALGVGPEGAFDGYTLYDINVVGKDGAYFMHYTGLDLPMGPGQKQAIGLATSRDLIHWERHPANPLLRADPRFYEQAVPREATYQEKDFGRLWFRDPWVFRDAASGRYGMLVGARDARQPADVRGCLAFAVSDDLIRWTPQPPLFSPGKYHTLECPCLFEHGGVHYVTFLTHHRWGVPFLSGDPHQTFGNFCAFSKHGLQGPWQAPDDSVAAGSNLHRSDGVRTGRIAGLKVVAGPDGRPYAYYAFSGLPAMGDEGGRELPNGVSAPKRLIFHADGRMAPAFNPETAGRYGEWIRLPDASPAASALPWKRDGGALRCKNFQGRSAILCGDTPENLICSTRVTFVHGERAGIMLRWAEGGGAGWWVALDRRHRRVEFGLAGQEGFLDARRWDPQSDTVELKLAIWGPSIEIYADDQLMLHQVRYREKGGRLGLFVERAEASFAPQ